MPSWGAFTFDIVAILVLVFGLYFPRHRRRDLVAAFLGINIGVLAVATALASAEASTGLGFGLFAVLSIIRLRSFELEHQEVAYYFVSLALGVLGGVPIDPEWLAPCLMATLLVVVFIGDHTQLLSRYHAQTITLDRAYPDHASLVAQLEATLGAKVDRAAVRELNFVNDTTVVDVRFRTTPAGVKAVP